jgi:DNA replication and repair protein RecF
MSDVSPDTPQGVGIRHLRLYNFRNYTEMEVDLGPGLNLFIGPNAQGKSNLLEAVATLLLLRSPRAPSAGELLRWGTSEAAVDAVVTRPALTESLGLRLQRESAGAPAVPAADDSRGRVTRTSLAEGRPVPAREVLGRCPLVLFWPDDLQLVKAGPEARRRLMDTVLSQLDRRAADELLRYRRVLEQRNSLLRQVRGGAAGDQLAAFDDALILHGSAVQASRAELVRRLDPLARHAMEELTAGREVLSLRYRPDSAAAGRDEAPAAADLGAALRRARPEELARGLTLVGPHRDDVELLIDGRPARLTASQGQQRTAVLATKLAELRYVQLRSGRLPVLLLDDVLSELDAERGAQLLEALTGGRPAPQALLTATEAPRVNGRATRSFQVRGGAVLSR